MVKYLKKKALYKLASDMLSENLPPCKEFEYRFYHGTEWMDCGGYHVCSQWGGNWIRITRNTYKEDEHGNDINNEDVFSEKRDGKYHYHSHNGKMVVVDKINYTEGQNYEQSNRNSKSEGRSIEDSIHSEPRSRTR